MKRILLSSACALAVVLIGTFANLNVAQSAKNDTTALSTKPKAATTKSFQLPCTTLPDNVQAVLRPVVTPDNNTNDIIPVPAQPENTEAAVPTVTTTKANTISKDNKSAKASANPAPVTCSNTSKPCATANCNNACSTSNTCTNDNNCQSADCQTPATAVPTTEVAADTSYNDAAGQTLTVDNVDLSTCNSIKDVVKKLQKNGCITKKNINIKTITSIQDIQDLLNNSNPGNNCPNNNNTNQPSPNTPPTDTGNTPVATKAPAVTPTTPPSNHSGISSYAEQVIQLVNAERAKQGLSSFTTTSALSSAANKRATEITQSFAHTRPNGSSFSTVLGEYGISYSASGENIAYGQRTPQDVVNGWMNSAGHRANILNSNFKKIGIGVHQAGNGTIYWTQLFTN